MKGMILTFLVIPVILVIAVRNPEATGHFVAVIVTTGAKLLSGVADFLARLLGGKPS